MNTTNGRHKTIVTEHGPREPGALGGWYVTCDTCHDWITHCSFRHMAEETGHMHTYYMLMRDYGDPTAPWQALDYDWDTGAGIVETVARGMDVPVEGVTIARVFDERHMSLIAAAPAMLAALLAAERYLYAYCADTTTLDGRYATKVVNQIRSVLSQVRQ